MMKKMISTIETQQDEILAFLGRIVNMESPSHEKSSVDAVMDVLQTAYEKMGFATRRIDQDHYGNHLVADLGSGKGGNDKQKGGKK